MLHWLCACVTLLAAALAQASFPQHTYDVVLMAETVYATASLAPLARLIERCVHAGSIVCVTR